MGEKVEEKVVKQRALIARLDQVIAVYELMSSFILGAALMGDIRGIREAVMEATSRIHEIEAADESD